MKKQLVLMPLILTSIVFGATNTNIKEVKKNQVSEPCQRIIVLEKAVAKLIQENKEINLKIKILEKKIQSQKIKTEIKYLPKKMVGPIMTKEEPESFEKKIKVMAKEKEKLDKNICIKKKIPIIGNPKDEYIPFKKIKVFYAQRDILGYKYPELDAKVILKPAFHGNEKIEADMWTYAGWIHDKNKKVWLRGFRLRPIFTQKKPPKGSIKYKIVKECNNAK